jgi:hypothetical protein
MNAILGTAISYRMHLAVIVNFPQFSFFHVYGFAANREQTLGVGHDWNVNPVVEFKMGRGINVRRN